MSHVLVVGGSGAIGSHVVEDLLYQENRVTVWDPLYTGKDENLPSHPLLTVRNSSVQEALEKRETGLSGDPEAIVICFVTEPEEIVRLAARFPFCSCVLLSCLESIFRGSKGECSERTEPRPGRNINDFLCLWSELTVSMGFKGHTIVRSATVFGSRCNSPIDALLSSIRDNGNAVLREEEFFRDFVDVSEVSRAVIEGVKSPSGLVHVCRSFFEGVDSVSSSVRSLSLGAVEIHRCNPPPARDRIYRSTRFEYRGETVYSYLDRMSQEWEGNQR